MPQPLKDPERGSPVIRTTANRGMCTTQAIGEPRAHRTSGMRHCSSWSGLDPSSPTPSLPHRMARAWSQHAPSPPHPTPPRPDDRINPPKLETHTFPGPGSPPFAYDKDERAGMNAALNMSVLFCTFGTHRWHVFTRAGNKIGGVARAKAATPKTRRHTQNMSGKCTICKLSRCEQCRHVFGMLQSNEQGVW